MAACAPHYRVQDAHCLAYKQDLRVARQVCVPMTIAQAKAALAANYDVDPGNIEIHLRG